MLILSANRDLRAESQAAVRHMGMLVDVVGSVAEAEQFCREGLPSFKRPRAVVFTDAFPTTATGKIRRVELRSMALGVLRPAAPAAEGTA